MTLSSENVQRKDVAIGGVIAILMAATFTYVGGKPLVVTFIPGLVIALGILIWFYVSQSPIPSGPSLYPLYFGALAWQFIHFTEEFVTGFRQAFFPLYGHAAISNDLLVGINMFSYFMFAVGFILAFRFRLRFLLLPAAFFIIYGVIGNAISHVWWVILAAGYFPGFLTALVYWIIGPVLLTAFLGSAKRAAIAIGCFAVILVPAITLGRDHATPAECHGFHDLLCYRR
jgi:hypothetical protein